MKKINLLIALIFCTITSTFAQIVIWTEAFQNNCAAACFATAYAGPNGAWTQTLTGTNNPEANVWFISGAECGNAAGACGSGCGTTDPSLHIGANDGFTTTDPGASYNAGGLCGVWFCVATNKRMESPTINLTGKSTITLNFNYIENGQTTIDNATLWYFNGSTWSLLNSLAKTPFGGCAPQGLWKAFSIVLPASANNNPNVKIGFRWVNNDDGVGGDPSFAVDDITLTVNPPLPIELISFNVGCTPTNGAVDLKWLSASEINNDFYTIERSSDAINFEIVTVVKGVGNSSNINSYFFRDMNALDGVSYYRLKQTDFNGNFEYFNIEVVNCFYQDESISIYPNPATTNFNIHLVGEKDENVFIEMYSAIGQKVINEKYTLIDRINTFLIDVSHLEKGIYLVRVEINEKNETKKIIIER